MLTHQPRSETHGGSLQKTGHTQDNQLKGCLTKLRLKPSIEKTDGFPILPGSRHIVYQHATGQVAVEDIVGRDWFERDGLVGFQRP